MEALLLLLLLYLCMFAVDGFSGIIFVPCGSDKKGNGRKRVVLFDGKESKNDNGRDLFEYFDPLLSPHAYPNGISPEYAPKKDPNIQKGGDSGISDNVSRTNNGKERIVDKLLPTNTPLQEQKQDQLPLLEEFQSLVGSNPESKPSSSGRTTGGLLSFLDRLEAERAEAKQNSSFSKKVPPQPPFDSNLSTLSNPDGTLDPVKNQDVDASKKPNASSSLQTSSEDKAQLHPPSFQSKGNLSSEDFFDPTISPHMYPNGTPDLVIGDNPKQEKSPSSSEALSEDFETQKDLKKKEQKVDQEIETIDFFDPTLSPHMYPNGTPDLVIGDKQEQKPEEPTSKRRVGVLLIDHGSKNDASNQALQELARLYQAKVNQDNKPGGVSVVIRASHMELASPSISEGLQALVQDDQVDEVVCHPFFLSSYGRHVSTDIPQLIQEAIKAQDIHIPVHTTKPVGSETNLMLGVIDDLVRKSSTIWE